MDREHDIVAALHSFNSEEPAPKAFLKVSIDEARLPGRVAARIWANGDPSISGNAFDYLQNIDDLAIQPLLETPEPRDPRKLARLVSLLADSEFGLRTRVLRRMEKLLIDKRPIVDPEPVGPAEERPTPRRVCDDAYVAMRRLVHFGDGAWDAHDAEWHFFHSPEHVRDDVIAKARRSKEWRFALHQPKDPEDVPPSDAFGPMK